MIHFLLHFARFSGVNVIAEGIEREGELNQLIDLGVHFGQGYLLGRPEPQCRDIEPGLRERIRSRARAVAIADHHSTQTITLGSLAQPPLVVQAGDDLVEVGRALTRDRQHAGVIVVDGRRYVGWCSRETVFDCIRQKQLLDPVGLITPAGVCALPPEASITEGLELAAVRNDADLASPLVLARGGTIMGVVMIRDLLEAARTALTEKSRRAALTGLPGRAAADQHFAELVDLANASNAEGRLAHIRDLAVIDIRNCSSFNTSMGYDLGDQLIRELAGAIRAVFQDEAHHVFTAHLGDDRFAVTARRGLIDDRLGRLIEHFRRSILPMLGELVTGEADTDTDTPLPLGLGLRILVMPEVFSRVADPRDIFRIEQQLRRHAKGRESTLDSACIVVHDRRFEPAGTVKADAA